MITPELRGYVRTALEDGRNVEDCRKDLLGAGWQAEDVDAAIREVGDVELNNKTMASAFLRKIKNAFAWLKIFRPTVWKVLLTVPMFLVFPWDIAANAICTQSIPGVCYGGTFWFGGFNLLAGLASEVTTWISGDHVYFEEWIDPLPYVAGFSYLFVCAVVRNEDKVLSKKVFKNLIHVVIPLAVICGIIFAVMVFVNLCGAQPINVVQQPFPRCLLYGWFAPSPSLNGWYE